MKTPPKLAAGQLLAIGSKIALCTNDGLSLLRGRFFKWSVLFVAGMLLAGFTTFAYVHARGIDYLSTGNQLLRHQAIMNGDAGNPWQYRILAPYLIEIGIKVMRRLSVTDPVAVTFILFRIAQDALIFWLAFAYYQKLGLSFLQSVMGMVILSWGMSYSHYDSDLQFSTFFDVIFYLLAGLALLNNRVVWIIPISILAALNRETSGLIPFLLLASAVACPGQTRKKVLLTFFLSIFAYFLIYLGLRAFYGEQELIIPYGHHHGLDLLLYNLFRIITWHNLISTLNFVPLIALAGYRKWPAALKMFFWTVVPVWLLVHSFGAVLAETRLLLVPQALIFIPGALIAVAQPSFSSRMMRS